MIQATGSASVMQRSAAVVAERGARQAAAAAYAATDEVQLSDMAQAQSQENAPIREDLVRHVKAEIADGSYMTDAKLDTVIDRLHRELFGA